MEVDKYVVIGSALLSLAGFYVPGFNTWFEKQSQAQKQLIMLAAIFIVVAGRFGLGCLGKDVAFACTPNGAYDALVQFVIAIAVNAGVYKATNYLKQDKTQYSVDDFLG